MERGHCCRWIAVFAVLSLCKQSCAEWNVTQEPANRSVPCGPHGNRSNCTEMITTAKWSGHFTKCPQDYTHYCIHGKCRFVHEQDTPSCICPKGYIGPRCEYIDFDLLVADRKSVIIACVVGALIFLLSLIVFICVCTHRRKLCGKKKRKEENTEEKLNTMSGTRENGESLLADTATVETHTV